MALSRNFTQGNGHRRLDDPGNSRINDGEMRRLMIEASEKLAQMLRLKERAPAQYAARLRDHHD